MIAVEQALKSAILAVLAADEGVMAVLGDPARVVDVDSPQPAFPYLEIARHLSEPAGAAGSDASEHRIDLAATSRLDGGVGSREVIGAVRTALDTAELELDGRRCVLLLPVFVDTLLENVGRWRTVIRIKAVVEAV
ncbi:MAG: DUF3168 domain-containing protein [Hyphomonadaceae bacterium]